MKSHTNTLLQGGPRVLISIKALPMGLSMLDQWGQAYHGALALPTPLIASQLSRNQIEELASYLSFVK